MEIARRVELETFLSSLPRYVSREDMSALLRGRDYFTSLPPELIRNIMKYLPSERLTFCLINKQMDKIARACMKRLPREMSTIKNNTRHGYYRSATMASSAEYLAWIPKDGECFIHISLRQLSTGREFSQRFIMNINDDVLGCKDDVLSIHGIALQDSTLLAVTGHNILHGLGTHTQVQIWQIDIEDLERTSECVLPY